MRLITLRIATVLLAAGLAMTATVGMAAQDEPTTRELVAMKLEEYRQALNLSDYQWTQVEQILKSGIREQVAIARRYGLDGTFDHFQSMDRKQKKALRKDLEESREFTRERMKRFLDKDQYKAFKAWQEDVHDEIVARLEAAPEGDA